MIYLGDFPTDATVYVPFHTFDSNGASITLTGLAVTDIEIYKDGSVTQRSSDAGYALLDTDGIDFDGTTGLHGFSIDLSNDTDSGFYAAGSEYWIVVSSVTVDTRAVSFIAAVFSIERSGAVLAILKAVSVTGAALTGTLSTTQMTTGLAEVTDDHYNGRLITWTSGVLLGQQSDITDYTGSSKMLDYTAVTEAPSNGDTFVIT